MRLRAAPSTLAVLMAGAFALRVAVPWPEVVRGGVLRLADEASWRHAARIDADVRGMPLLAAHDVPDPPLQDVLAAAITHVVGAIGGAVPPSPQTAGIVATLVAALAGALTLVPVHAIGRRLGGSVAGLVAAGAVGFVPGEVFLRSMAGDATPRALESLIALTSLALLLRAVAGGDVAGGDVAAGSVRRGACAGAVAGLLVAVSPAALLLVGGAALAGGAGLAAAAVSGRAVRGVAAALVAWAAGVVGTAFVARLALGPSDAWDTGLGAPGGSELTVRSLLEGYGATCVGAVLGAALVARRLAAGARPDLATFAAAAAFAFAAAWSDVRWGLVAGPAAAVLSGIAVAALSARLTETKEGDEPLPAWVGGAMWPIVLGAALVVPSAFQTAAVLRRPRTPDDDWAEVLRWMRHRTPEPSRTNGPDADPAYTVVSAPGRAPWVQTLARRAPLGGPSGVEASARILLDPDPASAVAAMDAARVRYLVLDAGIPLLPWPERGLRGDVAALARASGIPLDELAPVYHHRSPDGALVAAPLFTAAYHEALAVRLVLFGGRAVDAGPVWAWVWEPGEDDDGRPARIVVERRRFDDAAAAATWAAAQRGARVATGSPSPVVPCAALAPVEGLRLVRRSRTATPHPGSAEPAWNVQVWERDDS